MISFSRSDFKTKFCIHAIPDTLQKGGWDILLDRWGEFLHQYSLASLHEGKDDYAYWYNERALSGILAASAWTLKNGWSLEEFSTPRNISSVSAMGRGDLWIGTGKASYTIESKIYWPQSNRRIAIKNASNKLNEAREQLLSLDKEYREGDGVVLCYIVPELRNSRSYKHSLYIRTFANKIASSFSGEKIFVASYQEKNKPIDNKLFYPGVIIIGRQVPWSKQE